LLVVGCCAASLRAAEEATAPTPPKAPPERTYSRSPFVHRIVILDEDGAVIRPPKPGEEASATVSNKPISLARTCGKCHSDYDVMQHGWHFNFADAGAPHGRAGEPWILTDPQTRTQLPLSYRRWPGTFHPHDVGLNDFNFARVFGRHHPGGGALQYSTDLRFKMSGPLENDCLVCHVADRHYDPVARAAAIAVDQDFKWAPTAAAVLGKVQGQASRLRDNFDPTGPDARRAPKVTYDPARFDDAGNVFIDIQRRVPDQNCYFCHTSLDVDHGSNDSTNLESRWRHDRDIHLVKGMSCVDCHRHGVDHMMARGYEGEYEDRAKASAGGAERTITTLSCQGCHYGTDTMPGGRNAAPRPVHRGMPPLHFEKLSCTACHSGPRPTDATTLVQTSMSHQLGLPRRVTAAAAAPMIQQPVFLVDHRTGKLTPNRLLYPSYWAHLEGETLRPMLPEQVLAAGAGEILGDKPDPKAFVASSPLSEQQIVQVLDKIAAFVPPSVKPADAIGAPTTLRTTAATTAASTAPTPAPSSPAGEPVFVTGGVAYKRGGGGKLEATWPAAAAPYAWPIGHDVRGAQQALGARGCTECHANPAPVFDSAVSNASLIADRSASHPMHSFSSRSIASLRVFAATYPLRWLLIVIGYLSAAVLALVWLKQKLPAIGRRN
jgi:hypothetical protein